MATDSAQHRQLSFNLSKGKFEDLPGGALIIRDIPALAAGTWTDSHVQTALDYPARTLEQYAGNWLDNGFYYEHTGGRGHTADERTGDVFNPRYSEGAMVVDVMMHAMNPKSREQIPRIKSGEINMVSVEHAGEEALNPVTGRLEARTLEFYGLVPVVKGACKKCKIRNNSACKGDSASSEGKGMELKELTETFAGKADTVKELEAVKAEGTALKTRLDKAEQKIKELSDAPKTPDTTDLVKAQAEQIKELAEKVKKLEAAPAGTKTGAVQADEMKLIIVR